MLDKTTLFFGVDIPLPKLGLTFHVPTLKEIAYIGEESFFLGCGLLNFSKKMLDLEGKTDLNELSDFDVLMLIVNDKNDNGSLKKSKICFVQLLSLIFPNFSILIRKDCIVLKNDIEKVEFIIDDKNFEQIRSVACEEFCLNGDEDSFKAAGDMSKKIIEKIEAARRKRKELAPSKNESVLGRYASILSEGQHIAITTFGNYTIYQLFDAFQRYELHQNSILVKEMRLAGAQDVKDAEEWTKDLHS